MLPLDDAVDAFVAGFARLRGLRATIEVSRVDGLRRVRPVESQPERGVVEEFVAIGGDPAAVVAAVRRCDPAPRHYLSVLAADAHALQEVYASLGYVPDSVEYLMTRSLTPPPAAPPIPSGYALQPVLTKADVRTVAAAQRTAGLPERRIWQAEPDELDAPDLRSYAVFHVGGSPVAWMRTVAWRDVAYVSDVHTLPDHRRRGLAAALMAAALADAAAEGANWSVLTSSEAGHALYRGLGYADVLPLRIFASAGYGAA